MIRPISRGATFAAVTALPAVLVMAQPERTFGSDLAEIQQRVGTVKGSSWAELVASAEVPSSSVDYSFSSVVVKHFGESALEALQLSRPHWRR